MGTPRVCSGFCRALARFYQLFRPPISVAVLRTSKSQNYPEVLNIILCVVGTIIIHSILL